jgi:hypothetical protein
MAAFFVPVTELGLKAITGAESLTVSVKLAVPDPPVFEAVRVWTVAVV